MESAKSLLIGRGVLRAFTFFRFSSAALLVDSSQGDGSPCMQETILFKRAFPHRRGIPLSVPPRLVVS